MDLAGKVSVVLQDRFTGQVRGITAMNEETVAAALAASSVTLDGSTFRIATAHEGHGGAALLLLVEPQAPSGEGPFAKTLQASGPPVPFLEELGREIEARKQSTGQKSYTRHLLDGGSERIGNKIREEAGELAQAIAGEADDRVVAEAADVLFHVMVGLASRGLRLHHVVEKLASRAGTSGHEEKARRNQPAQ